MPTKTLSVLATCLFGASLTAQYLGEGPAVVTAAKDQPALGATALGVQDVQQILLVPHTSLPPNTYYVMATVHKIGAPAADYDIISGTYNATTQVFTKNTDVDALITTAGEFAGTVSSDLLVAAWDTSSSTAPMWATRAAPSGPFTGKGSISGVPAGYIDCMFGQIGGKLVLFYFQNPDLYVGDFDRNTGIVSNTRKVVTNPTAYQYTHSPSPMNDLSGETRALIFSAQVSGFRSNAWFTSALDDSAPKFEFHRTTTWLANPDANGGTTVWADHSTGTYYKDPVEVGILALSSATLPAATGGTLNMTVFAPTKQLTATPYPAAVWLGVLGSSGLSIPGVGGKISLDLTQQLITLPGMVLVPHIGTGTYSFNLPGPLPVMQFAGMPIILDIQANQLFVGSTGYYRFQ